MKNDDLILSPEDYAEPRCLLCDEPFGAAPSVKPVPQRRIIEKMDEYMSRRDYAGAERHLLYWLEEARLGGDLRGELLVNNELIGHYRKTQNRDRALESISEALRLVDELDFDGTVSAGTTYTNAATAYNAFGEDAKALELFEKAKTVYESAPATKPELLGGLYNNMALTCVSLKLFDRAFSLYDKALEAMKKVPGGELEQAITLLNMANALEARDGMEEAESGIFDLLDKASELLTDTTAPRNGYYAFVLEKCAPTFSYYGYFADAQRFSGIAEAIYKKENGDEGA